ncbi:MAG: hypothetical protein ACLGGX_06695 [Bdellovibrionia bacterium]
MTAKHHNLRKLAFRENLYSDFEKLDGTHPWKEAVPEGFIEYRVREISGGKVAYFNFVLAKEMGLLSADHPHQLNEDLTEKILETFCIQIINEYDEINKRKIPLHTIKPNKYMATRYLQLQHPDKKGLSSGDGRGIWNGTIQNRGTTWDISSRGTGVTRLSPGAVQAQKPLKTGGTEFGYGCGLAEIDELLGAAILAEVMHLQGIPTERVLCVIDLGKGYGIGVRAAQNLIRPAHLFLYLKQEKYAQLKSATDFLIERQVENKKWNIKSKNANRYDELLRNVSYSFAHFAALLDIDYIFAWLDWDGDNVLADAGIIDYGSVRQFGIRHDKYRYDDVERFSTNLNEQRLKARLIVQVFAQLVDYLKTGTKKNLREFANHPEVLKFNQTFAEKRNDRFLYRAGLSSAQRAVLSKNAQLADEFQKIYSYFERAKISGNTIKVADGVNHPALFNMRVALSLLPDFYAGQNNEKEFFQKILSSFAKKKDLKPGKKHLLSIKKLFVIYEKIVNAVSTKQNRSLVLNGIKKRACKLNNSQRITGNALIEIVDEIITQKKRGLTLEQIQNVIDRFIFEHLDLPEVHVSGHYKFLRQGTPAVRSDLYSKLKQLVLIHKEDI